jgi:hypothetical protein
MWDKSQVASRIWSWRSASETAEVIICFVLFSFCMGPWFRRHYISHGQTTGELVSETRQFRYFYGGFEK